MIDPANLLWLLDQLAREVRQYEAREPQLIARIAQLEAQLAAAQPSPEPPTNPPAPATVDA